jgi:hypothetical protein
MLRWHCKPELRLLKLGRVIALTIALGFYSPAVAECDLGEVVGWTLIAEKTVEGYVGGASSSYSGGNSSTSKPGGGVVNPSVPVLRGASNSKPGGGVAITALAPTGRRSSVPSLRSAYW